MTADSLDSIYTLPVNSRRDEILASVARNQVTIITAETGAGKSTQIPQFLAEAGYTKIIVTQPRILAARNLSSRVRQEYSWRTGSDATRLVGYRTAHEADDSPENIILYCTDGLQLVRELTGSGTNERQILILDEIHEWNENMEVLIAWAKKRCQEEPSFKIVLMSATIEATDLATYFGSAVPISIEGRSYPVTRYQGKNLIEEIRTKLSERTCNMLVFLPGKAEIEQVAEAISDVTGNIPVIPLHSQLDAATQQIAFRHYASGKVILSTNIAQTSVTIDDIDIVIDSGLERRAEVRSGVEGLFISEISQADCIQRAGRAGRVRPGEYILAKLDRLPCPPLEERPAYGVPEIMRKHIDRLALRLANINMDIEELEFFHAPSRNTIKQAKRTLTILGALENGIVTPLGRKMERFPVESTYSRMLVEATKYPPSVQSKLATIIAIQEVGGIVKGGPRHTGWQHYTRQNQSDLLAQYDVLIALPAIAEEDYEELGIIAKNIDKAMEIHERLHHDLGLAFTELSAIGSDETSLLKCIISGQLHQLWLTDEEGQARNIATGQQREVSGTTVARHAQFFAGTPFDLEVPTANGLETLHLVNAITIIKPEWLAELAPETFKFRPGKIYFDPKQGTLACPVELDIRGKKILLPSIPVLDHTPANRNLFAILYSDYVFTQLEIERKSYKSTNHQHIPGISSPKIRERVRRLASNAISLLEVPRNERTELYKLTQLQTWLGRDFMRTLHPPSRHRQPFRGHHSSKHSKPRYGRDKGS
jgi:late competence protein required for DNA uptake (superfamily II DNA/RNA helicase)